MQRPIEPGALVVSLLSSRIGLVLDVRRCPKGGQTRCLVLWAEGYVEEASRDWIDEILAVPRTP